MIVPSIVAMAFFVTVLFVVWKTSKCQQKLNVQNNGIRHFVIWRKVFKNGPSKVCGRQPLFGPFLNTLSQIFIRKWLKISQNSYK